MFEPPRHTPLTTLGGHRSMDWRRLWRRLLGRGPAQTAPEAEGNPELALIFQRSKALPPLTAAPELPPFPGENAASRPAARPRLSLKQPRQRSRPLRRDAAYREESLGGVQVQIRGASATPVAAPLPEPDPMILPEEPEASASFCSLEEIQVLLGETVAETQDEDDEDERTRVLAEYGLLDKPGERKAEDEHEQGEQAQPSAQEGNFWEKEIEAFYTDTRDAWDAAGQDHDDTCLNREARARQKAIELIEACDWDQSTLPLIQQIFETSGWGQTRLALEREIRKGMLPEELILATHLKAIWAERGFSHRVLSWPNALQLVRTFATLPQVEELERFLEQLYDGWYDTPVLHQAFRSFGRYLWFRTAPLNGCLSPELPFDFTGLHDLPVEEYSDLGLDDPLDIDQQAQLQALGVPAPRDHQRPSYAFDGELPA